MESYVECLQGRSWGVEERLLITAEQVRKIAAEKGLIAGVVEKDYALSWLLKEIYGTGGLKDSFVVELPH